MQKQEERCFRGLRKMEDQEGNMVLCLVGEPSYVSMEDSWFVSGRRPLTGHSELEVQAAERAVAEEDAALGNASFTELDPEDEGQAEAELERARDLQQEQLEQAAQLEAEAAAEKASGLVSGTTLMLVSREIEEGEGVRGVVMAKGCTALGTVEVEELAPLQGVVVTET